MPRKCDRPKKKKKNKDEEKLESALAQLRYLAYQQTGSNHGDALYLVEYLEERSRLPGEVGRKARQQIEQIIGSYYGYARRITP
jgi:hypothetical protein